VKMAPPSASVAGNVVGAPLAGVARNTARMSGRSTMAWPAMVSATPPAMISAVSVRPVQGLSSRVPGQSFHQRPIIATPDTANTVIGPRTSSDVAVLPSPRARAKNTTADSASPPRPTHGCLASTWRCSRTASRRRS
jgi:hypothetical protein